MISCADNPSGEACIRGQAVDDALKLALATGLGTHGLIIAVDAAAAGCLTNPVLCANEAGVFILEMLGAEAAPAGIALTGTAGLTAKLTKEQLVELATLQALKKEGGDVTPEMVSQVISGGVSKETPSINNSLFTNSDKAKNSETYFRVEGGGSGTKTSQNRINVNSDGSVSINSGCSSQLCVSTNGPNHAVYYLTNNRPDGSVVMFEIDATLHKQIMGSLVPQKPIPGVPKNPNAPKIVDPGTGEPSISIELPKVWDKLIEQNSSKGLVLTEKEFLNEFGK